MRAVDAVLLCLQNVSMANVLIRDLPAQTHRALAERARCHGQSLQAYLREEVERLGIGSTLEEILAGVETHSGGRVGFEEALTALDEARASR